MSDVRLIGEALVARGLLSQAELARALRVQERTGARLGAILVTAGTVSRLDFYRTMAEEWDLPFVDLTGETLDADLLSRFEPDRLLAGGYLPLGRDGAGRLLCASCEAPTGERLRQLEAEVGEPVELVVTTDWDIAVGLRRGYRDTILEDASMGLWRQDASQSARQVINGEQKVILGVALLMLVVAVVLAPAAALVAGIALTSMGFLVSVMFKLVVCFVGARHESDVGVTQAEVDALDERGLPIYTVLVPVYGEANVVADLVGNLGALDYPAAKLDIILLLEEDDQATIEAAWEARPPQTVRFVIVPEGQPKTKPKACNVGLFFARGELLVIYDAEDRPEPDQLKKAVVAFRRSEPHLVCLQAALNYWNARENWLTRMFTLEYSFWFDYMLPGLDRLRLPIPLGGTSNHFRTDALRALGGWDPFNVTEDADLGIRASTLGLTVGVLNSTTYEEANGNSYNWVRQRSRWIKGYIQTLLVHLRRPGQLVRNVGVVRGLAFLLLIGGTPVTFLATPPLLAVFALSFVVPGAWLASLFPSWVLLISILNLLVGNASMVYVSMMGAFKRQQYWLVPWALLNPVYWLYHAVASYKAAWQLVTRPHYWEKTLHGLSTLDIAGATRAQAELVEPPHVAR